MAKKTDYYKLLAWRNKIIEDMGGYTSDDFKKFARDYRNFLKRMCKNNGWELVKFNAGHYYCSWFIKKGDKYIYCSISDVRYFRDQWYRNILFRSARGENDYTGGSNRYSLLQNLEASIQRHFELLL